MPDVTMPQLGETVADGTVTKWFKAVGDHVEKGEALFEVSTDKVDTEIPAPASGPLSAIFVKEGETVDVGTRLALIGEGDAGGAPDSPASAPSAAVAATSSVPVAARVPSSAEGQKLSPVVRRLLTENGLEAGDVVGTGPEGRLTREDVLLHLETLASASKAAAPQGEGSHNVSPVVRRLLEGSGLTIDQVTGSGPGGRVTRRDVELAIANAATKPASAPAPVPVARSGDERIPFTKVRRLTAEHMVRSKATSAHTLMVREIDYEQVERVRRREGEAFKAREGFSLTYLPFLTVAVTRALRQFPHLNASVGDDELIVHHDLNVGIAVDLDSDGLVVPVVHAADALSVAEVARRIRDLATRARSKKLAVSDMERGTFTISNPGPYGTMLTGAIINQPQVAILATDGVTRRPVVVTGPDGEESIAIHSMGLITLNFDHRAVDGGYAARFLRAMNDELNRDDWTI